MISLTPTARPAPPAAVIRSQAEIEFRTLIGNGEQILLTLIIPVCLLLGLSLTTIVDVGAASAEARVQQVVPAVLALAIMSSAFTAQAIATGFDRRSEAIKFLGTTPLTRTGLLAAKVLAGLGIQLIQITVLLMVALAVQWRPEGPWPAAVLWMALGTAAFTSLGIALAGVLRAEITLVTANALYLLMLLAGGIIIPSSDLPGPLATVSGLLPSSALADGLRHALNGADTSVIGPAVVLIVWTVLGVAVTRRHFRWTS